MSSMSLILSADVVVAADNGVAIVSPLFLMLNNFVVQKMSCLQLKCRLQYCRQCHRRHHSIHYVELEDIEMEVLSMQVLTVQSAAAALMSS